MSTERYHAEQHLKNYDTKYLALPGAEMEILAEYIDDLLYPDAHEQPHIGVQRARVGNGNITTMFSHSYLRTDTSTMGSSVESIGFTIDHTQYLGRSALKQCYKVRIDSTVEQTVLRGVDLVIPPQNRVTSMFYIEQHAGNYAFNGMVIHPNIIGDPEPSDEDMTVYDCEQLLSSVLEVQRLATYDFRERRIILAEPDV